MDLKLLIDLGLSHSQAKSYTTLLEQGPLTPPELAQATGEKRTNTYMILDALQKLELVEKVEDIKPTKFRPANPVALERLSQRRRHDLMNNEALLNQFMPLMLKNFHRQTEKPGIRTFEGVNELREIYEDILRTGETLYLIRGRNNEQVLGRKYVADFIERRIESDIKVLILSPKFPEIKDDTERDRRWLMDRTWLDPSEYSEPVEISIYGSKIAIISFGHEIMGTIIESPSMSLAMKQLFLLLKSQLRQQEGSSEGSPIDGSQAFQNLL